ncbi:DUF1801 domain-containing protein [Nocardioides panacisoli]|uniref:DUF1801 domain-containing protein n=1 Tax=Nocardioides panacisoli TaxID=627624 RepID=UPI001C6387EA|nr:DUF1801 domain-containing protein [Nocardioides panacisoli]QYJ05342.1 DUF1801 domain-containing protein [Nocardioides panacisoli]
MSKRGDRMTERNDGSVEAFLDGVTPERRREDGYAALDLLSRVTGEEPVMWGASIVGFGRQPYTTADGKEREWFAVGFSPRKQALTFYGLTYYGSREDLLDRLGPHTTGKGCLYVKRLGDLDAQALEELVGRAWEENHTP